MLHLGEHAMLGFCGWDLPAVLLLAAVTALYVVRRRKQKQELEELEEAVSGS